MHYEPSFGFRLLIATRFHPEAIVLGLLPFLLPSRPFVIFCQFMEVSVVCVCVCIYTQCTCTHCTPFVQPLVQMYSKLKESGMVFDLHLSETWLRKYQVSRRGGGERRRGEGRGGEGREGKVRWKQGLSETTECRRNLN